MSQEVRNETEPDLKMSTSPFPESTDNLSNRYRYILTVSSGKGGVGKTTITLLLVAELLRRGYRVSLIDADVYGPNVPVMLGLKDVKLRVNPEGMIVPLTMGKLDIISVGFLLDRDDTPILWRGPMLHKLLSEFVNRVAWLGGDFLVIDMPPGTGDALLSISKLLDVKGGIVVTIPQRPSTADVSKMINTHIQLGIELIGLVVNMAYLKCPSCGKEIPLGNEVYVRELIDRYNITYTSKLPMDLELMSAADEGKLLDFVRERGSYMEETVDRLESLVSNLTQNPV